MTQHSEIEAQVARAEQALAGTDTEGFTAEIEQTFMDGLPLLFATIRALLSRLERVEGVLDQICVNSNCDWDQVRKHPARQIDIIHTMAVDARYDLAASLTKETDQ